jgi:AcrR family transcriptional regulator
MQGGGERRARTPSVDARAVRTRDRLREAYLAVSASGAVPLVSTVVRAAAVNRSSFYAHFDDMDDMSLWMLDEALGDLAASQAELARRAHQNTRVTAVAAGNAYLDAIEANRAALRAAVVADRARARARIGATMERTMLDFMAITPGWDDLSVNARATASWVSHGWAGVICAWLAGDIVATRDELLTELVALNVDGSRLP